MRHEILPYQKRAILDIEDFDGRSLCALDPGLGKTLISLHYLNRNNAWPALIICPASIKYQWQTHAAEQVGIRASVFEGQQPPIGDLLSHHQLSIINYDILWYWVRYINRLKLDAVIIDESQYISHRGTQRSKATKEVCKQRPHVLALSGTPLLNRPAELFPTLNILRPDVFSSFWSFAQEFCSPRLTPWGWSYTGASNLKKLNKLLLRTCMTRARKIDVLSELPEKNYEVVTLPLSDEREYKLAKDNFLRWVTGQGGGRLAAAARAQRFVQMGYLRRLAARLKLRALVEWVNTFLVDSEEKLVIFDLHHKMTEALVRHVNSSSVVVDGSITGTARRVAVIKFQADPSCRVFIGNIQAAGVGLDGLQVAQTCVFAELPWRPGDVTQAVDRLHRMGQRNAVTAYFAIARGTIEDHLCQVLQTKQQVVSTVLDGGEQEEDLKIFDLLQQSMVEEFGIGTTNANTHGRTEYDVSEETESGARKFRSTRLVPF